MRKEEFYFNSRDNQTKIHAIKWIPDTEKPIAILQIIHGMAEHIERYEDFAKFLADKGVLVTAEDHLGHGKSIDEKGKCGYFCAKDPATVVVRDSHRLKKMVQEEYPGVPYFILGHSMGSFIARNYMCRYGKGIDGMIVMGTGMQSKGLLYVTKFMAAFLSVFQGPKHTSELMDKMGFGNYTKRIENPRTGNDWLSKDEKIVDAYLSDPLCGFAFTLNGFGTVAELVLRLYNKDYLAQIPKNLPVFLVSGEEDPVGEYTVGVKKTYESLKEAGLTNLKMKFYKNDRHEILNELDKESVYQDMYDWLEKEGIKK